MTPPPPPPPVKILNRICMDLKNDPNGPEKKRISVKKRKNPMPALNILVNLCLGAGWGGGGGWD